MKKIGLLTLLITITILLTLAFSAAAAGPKAPAAAAPPPAAAPAMPPHPRVHDAIEEMRHAKEHMEHAEGEFHGHRVKAIEHLNQAIREAEICEREP